MRKRISWLTNVEPKCFLELQLLVPLREQLVVHECAKCVCVSALPCSLDGGYHIHMHNAVFVLQSFGRCIVLMQQTLIMFNFCVNKVSGFVSNNRRSVQCYSEIRENGVWWGLKRCVFLNGMEEGQYIRRALTKLSDGGFRYGMRQPIIQREDHKVCPARQSAECGTIITFWQNLPFFLKE